MAFGDDIRARVQKELDRLGVDWKGSVINYDEVMKRLEAGGTAFEPGHDTNALLATCLSTELYRVNSFHNKLLVQMELEFEPLRHNITANAEAISNGSKGVTYVHAFSKICDAIDRLRRCGVLNYTIVSVCYSSFEKQIEAMHPSCAPLQKPVPTVPVEQLEHLQQTYKNKREAILSDEFTSHDGKKRKLEAAKAYADAALRRAALSAAGREDEDVPRVVDPIKGFLAGEDFYEAKKLAEISKRASQLSYRLGEHGQQLRRRYLFPTSSENGFRVPLPTQQNQLPVHSAI